MRDKLYIDGHWREGTDFMPVIDPASGQAFHQVARASAADVDAAVASATRAFEHGWRRTTGAQRAHLLSKMADLIEERIDELAQLEVLDNGKPLPEARWDIEDTAGCFRYYAGLAAKLDDEQGEAVAVDMQGLGFYTTSEGNNQPIYYYTFL